MTASDSLLKNDCMDGPPAPPPLPASLFEFFDVVELDDDCPGPARFVELTFNASLPSAKRGSFSMFPGFSELCILYRMCFKHSDCKKSIEAH